MSIFTGWMGIFIELTIEGMGRDALWVSCSEREKISLRKVGEFAKGHMGRKWKIWDWNLDLLIDFNGCLTVKDF